MICWTTLAQASTGQSAVGRSFSVGSVVRYSFRHFFVVGM